MRFIAEQRKPGESHNQQHIFYFSPKELSSTGASTLTSCEGLRELRTPTGATNSGSPMFERVRTKYETGPFATTHDLEEGMQIIVSKEVTN